MARVRLADVAKSYGDVPAVVGLSLDVHDGELLVLVGPSGCGKSTTLRIVAGLEAADAGTLHIDDRDVTSAAPADRDVAMVFQSYALYPHMTVAENLGFALKLAGTARAEIERRVGEAAELLDLADLLGRRPRALSGGQRQRVAMGRAIVRSPEVFLMDEPLSNLDAQLRVRMRAEIAGLQRRLGVTTIYVTHDQVEAMSMGDRVAVLDRGELQQVAAPGELYRSPANLFVATFIGAPATNVVRAARVGRDCRLEGGHRFRLDDVEMAHHAAMTDRAEVVVGVRPEDARLHAADHAERSGAPEGRIIATGNVTVVEDTGADRFVHVDTGIAAQGAAVAPSAHGDVVVRVAAGVAVPGPGQRCIVSAAPGRSLVFDASTGVRLG